MKKKERKKEDREGCVLILLKLDLRCNVCVLYMREAGVGFSMKVDKSWGCV